MATKTTETAEDPITALHNQAQTVLAAEMAKRLSTKGPFDLNVDVEQTEQINALRDVIGLLSPWAVRE